jgi:hypothetical protein
MQSGTKRVFIRVFKILGWITASIILLLFAVILLIQIPAVQLRLTKKAISFLEKKIGTEVGLQSIHIAFPKEIVLKGIYLEDQQGDTLLYAGRFAVDTDLWALTRSEIQLNDITLENAVAFVDRPANDSAFNFTYILDAFAGDSTAVPDTLEQKQWDFSLETIHLEKIRLQFHDLLEGNLASATVGTFELTMDEFDLYHNRFGIGEILLSDTRGRFRQTRLPEKTDTTTQITETDSATLDLSVKSVAMKDVQLDYEQSAMEQVARLKVGEASVEAKLVDLINQQIELEEITLKETSISYSSGKGQQPATSEKKETEAELTQQQKPWRIALETLELENNNLTYDDLTKVETEGAINFNHLGLSNFSIDARDMIYNGSDIEVDLRRLSFQEKSGFAVESLKGLVSVTETTAKVEDLLLLTGNSRLQLQARSGFSSLQRIGEEYPKATFSTSINESFIGVQDLLYFNPSVLDSLPIHLSSQETLRIDAAVKGTVNNMTIDHLVFRMLSDTYLKTSGSIAGLPDASNIRINILLDKFYTTKSDMENVLPDTLLPDSVSLPLWLNLKGGIQGTAKVSAFNTLLTSNVGSIEVKGKINLDSTSALRGYQAVARITDLNIGEIMMKPDSVLGMLTMNADLETTGLTLEEMNGTVTASVEAFEYNGYHYKDLNIHGTIRDQILSSVVSMTEKNLEFALEGDYNFQESVPKYNITFDLKNADFNALNLTQRPLKARGTLLVNMATSDFRVLNGSVGLKKVAIFNGDDLYAVDSLLFASIDQEGKSEIDIDSDLLKARFEGSINIFALPGVLREYFNTYYSLHDSLEVKDAGRQRFSFDIQLKSTQLLTGILLPQLTSFVPGKITGEFDSEGQKLDLRMEINEIQYGNIGVHSFVFRTTSNPDALYYNFLVDRIMVDSMRIDGLEFNGQVANDSLRTDLIILDSANVHKYVLGGKFFSREAENDFELKLLPGKVKLNYQNWNVPPDNFFRFGGDKFIASNLQLVNGREKIIIESREQPGSPVYVGFRELNLEHLSSMIAQQRPLSGLLQGDINLFPDSAGMTFTSDLHINDFRIQDTGWGNIALAVEQKTKDRFDVDFGITGNENNVTAKGYYLGGERPDLNIAATISRFSLSSLQPLLAGQFKDLTGTLNGKMNVTGSPAKPDIDGRVQVNDTHFLSTYLNSAYTIDNEVITFNNAGIGFDEFQITDERKNEARIDGEILTTDYRNFKFNLDLFTDHFRLINTTAADNQLFYGKVDIEANARIRGTLTTPIIDIDIGMSEGSDLTYIVPQSEASVMEAEGIVKFVDRTFEDDPFLKKISAEAKDTVKSTFTGMDLTARIELSDKESFTIIIDPVTKDQLTVKGNSTLTLKIDPTGDIQLSGRYEISEGTYNLSFYKFVKREFDIEKGSTITWSGDPLNAQMDIHAIFEVETSPIELFSNQLTGSDPNEVNQYKQILPFLVYLNIAGQLLQPEIAFELEMPLDERDAFGGNVYARLQDINTRESELNKQVFALLILKRFIADNPFENQAGGGVEGTARNSVSKILSAQLNRLSENVKGVELSFDIKSYEDYKSGQAEGQTELQLGVSKSLFNDRLVVKLSGNVDVEGQNSNQEATDYIGDLALEYKITPDGRLRITGFRNSNYDMIDGELTETGAGLIYVKDYNTLSELFRSDAKTKN